MTPNFEKDRCMIDRVGERLWLDTMEKMGKVTAGGKRPHGEHTVQQKGHTKGKEVKMAGSKPLGMKKGGKC